MSSIIWHVAMSLDGFIAGPDDSMDWVFGERSEDGEERRKAQRNQVADEVMDSAGAILAGRRWYDVAVRSFNGYDGLYGGRWKGPVLVLTHRASDPDHHPAIRFLSTDLEEAVATARDAARGKAVLVFGANVAAQCIRAGLLDEIVVHLVPVLVGGGVRLFETPDIGPVPLHRELVATSGQITDMRFAVRRKGTAPSGAGE